MLTIAILSGLAAGIGLGFAIATFHQTRVWARLLELKTIAASPEPVKTATAIAHLESQRALDLLKPDDEKVKPDPPAVKQVLVDGVDLEFPGDSFLNKLV